MDNQITEKITTQKSLDKFQRDDFAKWVKDLFVKFHANRINQVSLAVELDKWRAMNQEVEVSAKWKSQYKDNKLATIALVKQAMVWKEAWSDPGQMYDVTNVDVDDVVEENLDKEKLQKFAINDALYKMKASIQFDKAYGYYQSWGEFIYAVGWDEHKIETKLYDPIQGKNGFKSTFTVYSNADIKAIDPMYFVFDTASADVEDERSWKKCIKIYKRFETLENIKADKRYKLTPEELAELDRGKDDTQTVRPDSTKNLADKTENGDNFEVLMLHGDFKFDGKCYKNYIAEVLAGKYLIRFEENPIFVTPFVIGIPEIDPETKRGIAPLKCILPTCKMRQNEINGKRNIDLLNENPPVIASSDFKEEVFKNKNAELWEPGKVLEYDKAISGTEFAKQTFDNSGRQENIAFMSNEISDVSGVNANYMGNVEQGKRTATELSFARQSTDIRTAKELDDIYKVTLEVIKTVARLLAMFKNGTERLLVKDKNERKIIAIDNSIRQGQYEYIYEDRNALIDRRARIQELFTLFQQLANDPELRQMANFREAITSYLEMQGFDNPEKFLNPETPLDGVFQKLKQLPEQMQEQVVQMIEQGMAEYEQNEQMQAMQQKAQEQALQAQIRQNARDEIEVANEL